MPPTPPEQPTENAIVSVSQLTDVSSTDWYFSALQSLIERFGVNIGYPDNTFRGERSLTRAEAVALVNQVLEKMSEMLEKHSQDGH